MKYQNNKKSFKSAKGLNVSRKIITYIILLIGTSIIITPFLYMVGTSIKDREQLKIIPPTILPFKFETTEIDGQIRSLYEVDLDGTPQKMALIKKAPEGMGFFAKVDSPDDQIKLKIDEQERLRTLDFNWDNYKTALNSQPFGRYILNTLIVTFASMTGILISSSFVAYGFARFSAKWLNILFVILLSTVMLPKQVTLIPLYVVFSKIGWVDTLLPLIIPAFFTSAYDVFLLRQFFLTIPKEMEEAAIIDGASRFQSFLFVIMPQSLPVLFTVCILHFIYVWNDFYEPLIYLHSQKNWTIAVGIQTFNAVYTENTHLVMAASVVMVIPPILLFFLTQRFFKQGVVISGVKG